MYTTIKGDIYFLFYWNQQAQASSTKDCGFESNTGRCCCVLLSVWASLAPHFFHHLFSKPQFLPYQSTLALVTSVNIRFLWQQIRKQFSWVFWGLYLSAASQAKLLKPLQHLKLHFQNLNDNILYSYWYSKGWFFFSSKYSYLAFKFAESICLWRNNRYGIKSIIKLVQVRQFNDTFDTHGSTCIYITDKELYSKVIHP